MLSCAMQVVNLRKEASEFELCALELLSYVLSDDVWLMRTCKDVPRRNPRPTSAD